MDNGEAKRRNQCVHNVQCEARRKPGVVGQHQESKYMWVNKFVLSVLNRLLSWAEGKPELSFVG